MQTILVIKHGALGDIVQALGAMQDIRTHHAGAEITLLTSPAYLGFFERSPYADRIIADPRPARWRIDALRRLKRRLGGPFDRIYDLQGSARTRFYRRVLFRRQDWSARPDPRRDTRDRSTLEDFADQLRKAGVRPEHTLSPDPRWMLDYGARAPEWPLNRRYAVLIPGSSAGHREKRWPGFAELAGRLSEEGLLPVAAPGPDEMAILEGSAALRLFRDGRPLDLFGLARLLSEADVVVGNDTGPTHLAAHLGCRGVALFGAGIAPERTGIGGTSMAWLQKEPLSSLSVDLVTKAAITARYPEARRKVQ